MLFQPGDIAACFGSDLTSRIVSYGTASPFAPQRLRVAPSHVAILCDPPGRVLKHHQQPPGRMLWVESTTLCPHPCLIRGTHVAGSQAQQPEDRIADYAHGGGRVDLYRLADVNSLTGRERRLLTQLLIDRFVRRAIDYDLRGAVLSGTRVFQLTRCFPRADLSQLFCSEMIAAVLMRLGRLNRENPSRFHPGRLLRTLVRTGVYACLGPITPPPVAAPFPTTSQPYHTHPCLSSLTERRFGDNR
ncbi:MAG: hypothetical protein R3C01_17365 [Planctomycetaceae bacterium]